MSDDIKLNWWAQELLKLRRKSQQEAGIDLKYLGNQDNLIGWKKIASKVMGGTLTPPDVWRLIVGDAAARPFHEVMKACSSFAALQLLAGSALVTQERAEMEALGLNPEILDQIVEYRIRDRLRRLAIAYERRLNTVDFSAPSVLKELALNLDNFPAWVVYILGAGNQKVFDNWGAEGIEFFKNNPMHGEACIRLGFPSEIIFPGGHPYESNT